MSPELAVQQGLRLAILLMAPLALAAATGGSIAGLLAGWIGLQDQTVSLVARIACVALVLLFFAPELAASVVELTAELWSGLALAGGAKG